MRPLCLQIFLIVWISSLPALRAQIPYSLVKPEGVQARLDLYKGNDSEREASLKKIFAEAGCASLNLAEQVVPKVKEPNVICVLPGSIPETILIGAHFDHISLGSGFVDNWSGASLLPSLFQSLLGSPHRHTFVFVGFSSEETGLKGSNFYARHLSKDELSRIQLMVNLDTLGLGPSEVWASRSDKHALNLLIATAHAINLPLSGMNVDGFGDSDEESFIPLDVCTITIHSLTPQTAHILHNAADAPSALHFHDYYETYHLLAAYLSVLDTQLGSEDSTCAPKSKK